LIKLRPILLFYYHLPFSILDYSILFLAIDEDEVNQHL